MDTRAESANYVFGWIVLALTVSLPLLSLYILSRPLYVLQEIDFKERWGTLYSELNPKFNAQSYQLVFMLRRVAYVAIIFYLLQW